MVNSNEQPKNRLSRNFLVSEFTCKGEGCNCAYQNAQIEPYLLLDPIFVQKLQAIRDDVEFPLVINSGARCVAYNEEVGGAATSAHLVTGLIPARAADISTKGLSPAKKYTLLKAAIKYGMHGIGIYKTFIHLDNKKRKSVWWGDT